MNAADAEGGLMLPQSASDGVDMTTDPRTAPLIEQAAE